MSKLLRAGFYRLKKDKAFRIAAVIVILATSLVTLQCIGSYGGDYRRGIIMDDMEDYFFNQAPVMGMLTAVFVSLFWGREYSDGTIRNKLCVGRQRSHVYLSHFAVCLTANLAFLGLWFLCASPMYFFIGPMAMGWAGFLIYAAVCVCFVTAFTAVFSWICAMVTNKAYSVVVALGTWMLMQMTSSGIYDRLCEPEIRGPYQMMVGTEFVTVEAGPNPLYIGGPLRTVLEHIVEFLPTGDTLLVNCVDVQYPLRVIFLSLTFTALFLLLGVRMFRKKDIR